MIDTVLSVRDLHVDFTAEAGVVHAVRGIDLDLHAGQTLALVGESGSGKSATASAIIGLLPGNAQVSGKVELGGANLLDLGDTAMSDYRGRRIGMVFQDPLSALTPILSIGRQLTDALRVHQRISKPAAQRRAIELLDLVGIPDPVKRMASFPHELSGGMRQRVVIAIAIANDPDVIIADEPTTALDVTVQAQVLEVLARAQDETGAALLLVSHDLGVVAGQADRVAVMYAGRIVENAPVETLFAEPRMPYSIGLLQAQPATARPGSMLPSIEGEPPNLSDLPSGCPFAPRCPAVQDRCRSDEPPLVAVGDSDHLAACVRSSELADRALDATTLFAAGDVTLAKRAETDDEPVLEVSGLHKSFPITRGAFLRRHVGDRPAVRGVDLAVRAGRTLGLVGESGSGKTTTLLEVMRLTPPQAGRVSVLGRTIDTDLSRQDRTALRRSVQIVMQDPTGALDPRLPVYDLLAEPLQAVGADKAEIRSRVYELLRLVGLDSNAVDRFPSEFSGGQRQRIGIARALATQPEIVVLDEPVSALDTSVQASILNLLIRLQRELGLAYLLVAHDLSVIRHVSDDVAVMYLGTIVESAPTEVLFANPRHPYTKALLSAIPLPDPVAERSREHVPLRGEIPSAESVTRGCVFVSRCPLYRELPDAVQAKCREVTPELDPELDPGDESPDHRVACHGLTTV